MSIKNNFLFVFFLIIFIGAAFFTSLLIYPQVSDLANVGMCASGSCGCLCAYCALSDCPVCPDGTCESGECDSSLTSPPFTVNVYCPNDCSSADCQGDGICNTDTPYNECATFPDDCTDITCCVGAVDMDGDDYHAILPGCSTARDKDDNDPCINPGAPEGLFNGGCPAGDDVCGVEYYAATNQCAINCNDGRDNDQRDGADENDQKCPKFGGIVNCGRNVDDPTTVVREDAPCSTCHSLVLLKRVIDFMVEVVAIPIFAIMLVTGGIFWITSGGSPSGIERGKGLVKIAGIALVIVVGGWMIVETIINGFVPSSSVMPWNSWNEIECPYCGDGICNGTEDATNCSYDCP